MLFYGAFRCNDNLYQSFLIGHFAPISLFALGNSMSIQCVCIYMCVHVCVCCVCARVYARVCVCMCQPPCGGPGNAPQLILCGVASPGLSHVVGTRVHWS